MKHLDLFSGIGGFALAARWVGWETIGFCEIDEYCRNVIKKNFGSNRWISLSGFIDGRPYRLGLERDQELSRISPDWLIIENVAFRWRDWLPELRRRLHALGYASLPIRVRASDLGAPHDRARVFLVAHANCNGESLRAVYEKVAELRKTTRYWRDNADPMGVDDGLPPRMDRIRGLGNAIVPQIAQIIFEAINAVEDNNGNTQPQTP